jgi:hypothetical protein
MYQAVFAMFVFNWDGDGAPVMKVGFKYYWAVAVPLTFVVLVLWTLVTRSPSHGLEGVLQKLE